MLASVAPPPAVRSLLERYVELLESVDWLHIRRNHNLSDLHGLDSLLSIAQMPATTPTSCSPCSIVSRTRWPST